MKTSDYSMAHSWPAVLLLLMMSAASAESMNGFRLDDALIPAQEIKSGGSPRDGTPSLDYPEFVAAEDASYLKGRDRVLGISIKSDARAYPFKELKKGESLFGDEFGEERIKVDTYGNFLTCTASLTGVVVEELDPENLTMRSPMFRACSPSNRFFPSASSRRISSRKQASPPHVSPSAA